MKKLVILLCATASLTACDAEDNARIRLERGCEAAVKVMLAKPDFDRQLSKVNSSKFGVSEGYRLVTINVTTDPKESGMEAEENFDCKFEESSMLFGFAWKAALVQVQIDDKIYGSEGGELYGSVEDQMALTAAVEAAMK